MITFKQYEDTVKKIAKKLGNDDLFLIFYNFCCNCTFYMRSKYVGGMV